MWNSSKFPTFTLWLKNSCKNSQLQELPKHPYEPHAESDTPMRRCLFQFSPRIQKELRSRMGANPCLLYTSDAADDWLVV